MRMSQIKFPHITRFFAATPVSSRLIAWFERPLLWISLGAFISLNLYAQTVLTNQTRDKRFGALLAPNAIASHLDLAQLYWRIGLPARARQELILTQEIPSESSQKAVLGASTQPLELLRAWEAEPVQVATSYILWQHVAQEKPDYRDAYLVLSTLAYRLGRLSEAKMNLDRALLLDPNSTQGQQLQQLFSN